MCDNSNDMPASEAAAGPAAKRAVKADESPII